MAPVSGPCISEPTLCVGFCIALDSVGAIAGHGPAGKKTEKTRRYFRGAGHGLGAARPQDPQRGSRPRQNGEKRLERLFFLPFWRCSTYNSGVPEPPYLKMAYKKGMVRRPCLFCFESFACFLEQRPTDGEVWMFPLPPSYGVNGWSFFAYFLCKESRCKESRSSQIPGSKQFGPQVGGGGLSRCAGGR